MRRRLTLTTVAAALVAVVALGLPLAVAVRSLVLDLAERALLAEAGAIAALLEEAPTPLLQDQLADFAVETSAELAIVRGGRVLPLTSGFDADVLQGLRRVPPAVGPGLVVSVPVDSWGAGAQLVVDGDETAAHARVRDAWVWIGAVAGAAIIIAAAVGSWQAREIAAPLEDLVIDARRLGEGDFTSRATRSGLPEADMVAEALDLTAERIGALVERANSLSADASHQLRTPLTALRLNLDALREISADDSGPSLDAALHEVDRLERTVEELVSLSTPGRGGEVVDPSVVVAERLGLWRTLADAQGRAVRTEVERTPPVRVRPAAVGQALQVLLDNALVHGDGEIVVEVAPAARDPRWVRISVTDEGPGFPKPPPPPAPGAERADASEPADRPADRPESSRRSGGHGLPLARSLIAAEGGSLRVEPVAQGARVSLLLPAAASEAGT